MLSHSLSRWRSSLRSQCSDGPRDFDSHRCSCVSEVFGPSFEYGRQWLSDDGREWALEFTADVGDSGKTVHGIDLVSLCEEGKIMEFTVLARPPNAVAALKDAMMRKVPVRLAKLKAKQALGIA